MLILTLRRGAHRVGGDKIRLGAGVLILPLRRGAHRVGGDKIRLGAGVLILTLRRGAHRVGGDKIRLGAGVLILTLRRGAHRLILTLRRGAHRAGVGKIRLGWIRARDLLTLELQHLFQLSYGSLLRLDLFPGEALTGLEAIRSVSELGIKVP